MSTNAQLKKAVESLEQVVTNLERAFAAMEQKTESIDERASTLEGQSESLTNNLAASVMRIAELEEAEQLKPEESTYTALYEKICLQLIASNGIRNFNARADAAQIAQIAHETMREIAPHLCEK